MKICHVCGIECDDSQEVCLVCGADLTESEAASEENGATVINEPVLVATFEDVVSSEIFRDILTDNGIPYSMGNDEGAIVVMFGGGFSTDEIYVDKRGFFHVIEGTEKEKQSKTLGNAERCRFKGTRYKNRSPRKCEV